MNGMKALKAARSIVDAAKDLGIPNIEWPYIDTLAVEIGQAAKRRHLTFLEGGRVYDAKMDLAHYPVGFIADPVNNVVHIVHYENQDAFIRFDLVTGQTILMLNYDAQLSPKDILDESKVLTKVEVAFE